MDEGRVREGERKKGRRAGNSGKGGRRKGKSKRRKEEGGTKGKNRERERIEDTILKSHYRLLHSTEFHFWIFFVPVSVIKKNKEREIKVKKNTSRFKH